MKLLVNVNQAKALQRGIDAPSSTAQIEIDPAELTQTERDLLIAFAPNGHDATVGIVGGSHLYVVVATMSGLRTTLAEIGEQQAKIRAEYEARRAAEVAEAMSPCRRLRRIVMTQGGEIMLGSQVGSDREFVSLTVEIIDLKVRSYLTSNPVVLAAREQITLDQAAEIESLRPELDALRQEKLNRMAENERKSAAQKAAYDALYARLPEGFRARHAGGYATQAEIQRAMRALVRTDAGYAPKNELWQESVKSAELTDEEFARLVAVRERAPSGATVEAKLCWSVEYRKADDEDDEDEIDKDGEVAERVNERRQIVVKWTHESGLEITASEPLEAP